nr:hypothetical protein [uncultured Psychroserpens sp.]
MKKLTTLLALVLLISTSTYAQMGMKKLMEESKEIKERILLVVLQDDEIENFEQFNTTLKSVIDNNWVLHEDYKFISREELKTLRKNKKEAKNHAYLMYSSYAVVNNFPESSFRIGLLDKKICTHFQMIDSDEDTFNTVDILFTIQRLQEIVTGLADYKKMSKSDFKNISKKQAEQVQAIKGKTLLIDEDIVNDKTRKLLESKYKYAYKIVSKKEIDNAIAKKEKDVAFTKAIIQASAPTRSNKRNTLGGEAITVRNSSSITAIIHSIYDAETGNAIYAFNMPKSKVVLGGINSKMNHKDFEELIDALD